MGTFVVRDGYVNGNVERVAYVGDLRVSGSRDAHRQLSGLLNEAMNDLADRHGVRYAHGCIVRGNAIARASLLRNRRGDRPRLEHLRGYHDVLVLGSKPRWGRPSFAVGSSFTVRPPFTVRRATDADFPALRTFLDRQSRATTFGPVFTATELQRRFDTWPALGIASFYLAFDRAGELCGCAAPWDASSIKRIRIRLGSALLRAFARGANRLRRGSPPLPVDGEELPTSYLSHVHVRDRDPRVLDALLQRIVADFRRERRGFLSLCAFDDDPLNAALSRYFTVRTPMDLYVLRPRPAAAPPITSTAIPGFEIALV